MKVLFVCLGNICRSPMAEAVMKKMVADAGQQDSFVIESAATSSWEVGNPPHRGTKKILQQHGISVGGLHSCQITTADFEKYDLILGMDHNNVTDLLKRAPAEYRHKVQLFLHILPDSEIAEVPDPYYTGDFKLTYQLVTAGCKAWFAHFQTFL